MAAEATRNPPPRHLSLITQRDSQPGRHPVTLRARTQEPPAPPATANPQAGRFAALTECQWALLAALGGAALLYAAHRPAALTVLGSVGIFAAALKLFDSMIELGFPGRPEDAGLILGANPQASAVSG
jgi:hypothetical protein